MSAGNPLSPAERSLRARIGGYARAAKYGSHEMTAAARAAGPGHMTHWLNKVDPDGVLGREDRLKRAEAAKSAHYAQMAYLSAKARRRR